jgi:hypothetical protein
VKEVVPKNAVYAVLADSGFEFDVYSYKDKSFMIRN